MTMERFILWNASFFTLAVGLTDGGEHEISPRSSLRSLCSLRLNNYG
jgi:hypothetical protein